MSRLKLACGLLILSALQTGCCSSKFCGGGCGEKYWGAYCDDPPRPEPCDCFGNWTGNCGSACGSKYPWVRSRGNRTGIWSLFGCGSDSCTDSCSEPACGEPACAASEPTCEPSCGEPNCGEPGCGCGDSHLISSRSPRRNVVPMQTVSRSSTVDYRMQSAAAPCNCGKQH